MAMDAVLATIVDSRAISKCAGSKLIASLFIVLNNTKPKHSCPTPLEEISCNRLGKAIDPMS